jgi:hypothetical protein
MASRRAKEAFSTGCGVLGGVLSTKLSLRSVFKKSNLASAVVVIVPENSHKTEDELIWRWLDAALGATPSL